MLLPFIKVERVNIFRTNSGVFIRMVLTFDPHVEKCQRSFPTVHNSGEYVVIWVLNFKSKELKFHQSVS